MPKKVAIIDSVFSIEGRGTIIALPEECAWSIPASEAIYRRERIQIRSPAGETISTFVEDISFLNRRPNKGSVALGLPASIRPSDIPPGSEIWLQRDGTEPMIEP